MRMAIVERFGRQRGRRGTRRRGLGAAILAVPRLQFHARNRKTSYELLRSSPGTKSARLSYPRVEFSNIEGDRGPLASLSG